MIDTELREMFADREALIPESGRVAGLITGRIRQRQSRLRAVRAVAVAAVALVLVTGVGLLATRRTQSPPVAPSTSAPTSTPSGRLVVAPDPKPVIAVRLTWLPADLTAPQVFSNMQNGVDIGQAGNDMRSVTYERVPSLDPGTESVMVLTRTANPAAGVRDSDPSWVTQSDTATVDVNGHTAQRYRMSSKSVGSRTCAIGWEQRKDLWVTVTVVERTTNPTLNCDHGLRVASGVVEQPMDLPRTVRLTLVPAGFRLIQTGTSVESWCTGATDPGRRCVAAQTGRGTGAAPGTPVTVHGHPGTLDRHNGGFQLNVPGRIQISSQTSDLTDPEILAIADSAVLDGGW